MSIINDSFMLDNDVVRVQLGARIRKLRIEKKYTLKEFAFKIEVEYSNLIRIEKGRSNVRLSTLVNVANGLEVPLTSLFK